MYDNRKRKNHLWTIRSVSLAAKSDTHQTKVMVYVLCITANIVHYEYLESGNTILNTIAKSPEAALVNRRRVLSARLDTAKTTRKVIKTLDWKVLPYPLYFPKISPSD